MHKIESGGWLALFMWQTETLKYSVSLCSCLLNINAYSHTHYCTYMVLQKSVKQNHNAQTLILLAMHGHSQSCIIMVWVYANNSSDMKISNYSISIAFTVLFILQSLVRGGVSVNVNLEYQIEGSEEGRLCPTGTPRAQACIGVSDGWRNNRINLEAWYQIRSIRWCSRRVWGRTFISQC